MNATTKLCASYDMMRTCVGTRGIYAAPERYRWQCWNRDESIALGPVLLDLGMTDAVLRHLLSTAALQKPDGQVPILFLDGPLGHAHFLAEKVYRSIRSGRMSFMLRRYIEERGDLSQLTPGTTDSELHFVIAVKEFLAHPAAKAVVSRDDAHTLEIAANMAMGYILNSRLNRNGYLEGADWRDTMEKRLVHTPVLSNQARLVHAYDLMDMPEEAEELRQAINRDYWSDGVLLDWPGCTEQQRFDPIGASFCILYDVLDLYEVHNEIAACFQDVNTPCGVTIQCKHNAYEPAEVEIIERSNGVVVWPLGVGLTILAAKRAQNTFARAKEGYPFHDLRKDLFKKFVGLEGLAEWYDPQTGRPCGAKRQLWSAAMFIRAFDSMQEV